MEISRRILRICTQQLVLDEIHRLVKRELQPHDNGKSGGIRLITNQNMRVFGDLSVEVPTAVASLREAVGPPAAFNLHFHPILLVP